MVRIGIESGTNPAVCEAANEHCNDRIINLLMWEAASRMVLTTTLPCSSHLPASLLRRTMNLVMIQIRMRTSMMIDCDDSGENNDFLFVENTALDMYNTGDGQHN